MRPDHETERRPPPGGLWNENGYFRHGRSPITSRRAAAIARSRSPVFAERLSISRLRQPANAMTSPSCIPQALLERSLALEAALSHQSAPKCANRRRRARGPDTTKEDRERQAGAVTGRCSIMREQHVGPIEPALGGRGGEFLVDPCASCGYKWPIGLLAPGHRQTVANALAAGGAEDSAVSSSWKKRRSSSLWFGSRRMASRRSDRVILGLGAG
jgi:hypothetical protein